MWVNYVLMVLMIKETTQDTVQNTCPIHLDALTRWCACEMLEKERNFQRVSTPRLRHHPEKWCGRSKRALACAAHELTTSACRQASATIFAGTSKVWCGTLALKAFFNIMWERRRRRNYKKMVQAYLFQACFSLAITSSSFVRLSHPISSSAWHITERPLVPAQ